ncbi:MAG TPA: glycosyltransferase family 39 protein [Bryobacteraceae bacterium]|nr:glycosyltransferase family 39 protein [Bryobacteraceae bacterium]
MCAAVMAAHVRYVFLSGCTLWFGDAEAHLNIARRIVDSRSPGLYQIGSVWLPLPHLLMAPLVRKDWYWQTGLAGAIPAAICMTLAATFLFATLRRLFDSAVAAAAGTAVFLLNPNTLYLGSIPMTEPVFFASSLALLYFTVRFHATQGWGAILGASLAAFCGTLTRYDGWALLPVVALFILVAGPRNRFPKRLACAIVFSIIAAAGPFLWLLHNRWFYGDPLYFYRGPYSAIAITGAMPYPGKNNWPVAAQYFFEAGRLVAGWPGLLIGAAGLALCLWRRAIWPVFLLLVPCAFYISSVHGSGTPIFVPTLWPFTHYNTRFALAFLPLVALGVAALAKLYRPAAAVPALLALAPFLIHPTQRPITWTESDRNSEARRKWTYAAADYLKANARPTDTFLTSFGDMTGIFRAAGIPLNRTITTENIIEWAEVTTHPEMFLFEDWAVVSSGETMQTKIDRLRMRSPRYDLEQRIMVKGQPVIELYRRQPDPLPEGAMPPQSTENENPVP